MKPSPYVGLRSISQKDVHATHTQTLRMLHKRELGTSKRSLAVPSRTLFATRPCSHTSLRSSPDAKRSGQVAMGDTQPVSKMVMATKTVESRPGEELLASIVEEAKAFVLPQTHIKKNINSHSEAAIDSDLRTRQAIKFV